jgi:prevent-host-death family protein
MPRIGLRELKIHLSEVAKDVQENNARYTVTNRGEPVALLVPYSRVGETEPEDPAAAWGELVDLLHEAGRTARWEQSTEEIMDRQRRY